MDGYMNGWMDLWMDQWICRWVGDIARWWLRIWMYKNMES